MAKALTLKNHLSTAQLEHKYKTCEDVDEARKWQFLLLLSRGQTAPDAAKTVCTPVTTCRDWLHKYNNNGPDSVSDGRSLPRSRGLEPALTPQQFSELVMVACGQALRSFAGLKPRQEKSTGLS